jgi:hypothetical protein
MLKGSQDEVHMLYAHCIFFCPCSFLYVCPIVFAHVGYCSNRHTGILHLIIFCFSYLLVSPVFIFVLPEDSAQIFTKVQ